MSDLVQKFSRLGQFDELKYEDTLRGTPFWQKRDTILNNPKTLANRPLYRTLKIVKRLGLASGLTTNQVDDFLEWSFSYISQDERDFPAVKRFQRSYGNFPTQHMLLTSKNAIELYIQTVLK